MLLSGCQKEAPVEPADSPATIQQTVLYEENGISITAVELTEGLLGPKVVMQIVNTTEKNITVTVGEVSVNGYMMPLSGGYYTVAAGETVTDGITLMTEDLKQAAIEILARIEFRVHLRETDTAAVIDDSDVIRLTTSRWIYFQPADDAGETLFKGKKIRIVSKGLQEDNAWDGTLVFFMENKSKKDIYIFAENLEVNGKKVDAGLWCTLRRGTNLVDGMALLNMDELALTDISQIHTIVFDIRIADASDLSLVDHKENITLNFGETEETPETT